MQGTGKKIMLILSVFVSSHLFSQAKVPSEANQFDFWIGDWELTWSDTIWLILNRQKSLKEIFRKQMVE